MTGAMHDRPRRRPLIVSLLALAALDGVAVAPVGVAAAFTISLDPVVSGLESPTQITNAHDGTNRLFVVEQRGTIRVIQGGVLQPGYFLDIRSKVEDGGERGLLGLAFHPQLRDEPLPVRLLHAQRRRHRRVAVHDERRANRRHRIERAPAAPDRTQRRGQSQRRRARVQPDRPLPVHRRRRWRRGRRSGQRRPEEGQPPRQDPADQRERHGRRPVRQLLGAAGAIRSTARSPAWRRSGHTGCAIRGGSRSTAGPASSSSPTSGRAGGRRSIARRPASGAAGTTAGTRWRACTATRRRSARWPATRSRTSSTRTTAATARSPAATSTAGRPRPR